MRRATITGAAILAAVLPLACGDGGGSSEEEDQIRAALETTEAAIQDRDIEAFCASTAPSYVDRIGGQAKCVKGFKTDILFTAKSDPVAMEADEIEFEGEGAVVTLTNGFTVNFVEEGGKWYFEPFAPPGDVTSTVPIPDPSDVPTAPPES
jgi:hypothetical protein